MDDKRTEDPIVGVLLLGGLLAWGAGVWAWLSERPEAETVLSTVNDLAAVLMWLGSTLLICAAIVWRRR